MHPLSHSAARAAIGMLLVLSTAGCGKTDKPVMASSASRAPAANAGSDQGASAEAVARQARGDLSCPAKTAARSRPDNAPVDDVLGVRPGLSYEEAMNAVLCTHELLVALPDASRGFNLKAAEARSVRQGFGAAFAEPRVVRRSVESRQRPLRHGSARMKD